MTKFLFYQDEVGVYYPTTLKTDVEMKSEVFYVRYCYGNFDHNNYEDHVERESVVRLNTGTFLLRSVEITILFKPE